ncbi:hypothetical protein BH09BAC5_BH09BAC5_30000 [soil metagenome]
MRICSSIIENRVKQIQKEIKIIENKFEPEIELLQKELQKIKRNCTHPEVGLDTGMFICPDCSCNGSPEYPEQLSERDHDDYEENIEKSREWRRKLKVKFTRKEIKTMYFNTKENLEFLQKKCNSETTILSKEWIDSSLVWEQIKKQHLYVYGSKNYRELQNKK